MNLLFLEKGVEKLDKEKKSYSENEDSSRILPCHRIVRDLNGLSDQALIGSLKFNFEVMGMPPGFICRPVEQHCFGLYLHGCWYHLKAYPDVYEGKNVLENLDVNILQEKVLRPVFGILDPIRDERIFLMDSSVTLEEMQQIADRNQGALFVLYPPSEEQLREIREKGFSIPVMTYCREKKN